MKRHDKIIIAGLFLVCLVVFPSLSAAQSNLYVATNGVDNTEAGRGQSWALPYLTISNGVAHANTANDTVLVSNGTYYLTTQISISRVITLKGLNGASNTFADGSNITRCLNMDNYGTVDGLTFQHGSTNYGAGISINKGNISNCWVISNVAGYYGGIYLTGPCTVNLCEIKFNIATNASGGNGGGIGGGSAASRVFNSLIQGNYSYDYSGGVNLEGGVISNCTIMANSNYNRGGGGISVGSGAIAQDCKISNNWTRSTGGGCRITGSGVATNCIISSNWAGGGGGGAWILSPATTCIMLRNCIISNNESSASGGGVSADNYGGQAYHCVIVNNRASSGGGIYCYAETNVFSHCQIINNTATNGTGGGVYLRWYGNFTNCVIAGNRAYTSGGGVRYDQGGRVQNCLIYNNVASNGGGIYVELMGTYKGFLSSCTIAGNTATNGGGMYLSSTTNGITNSIIYSNTAVLSSPDIYATGGNTNAFFYCCANFANFPQGQGNKTNDPLFNNPAVGNYRLASGSPCINAGTNLSWMTNANVFDMDDMIRIRYGAVDMGCYERIFPGMMFSAH